MSGFSGMKAWLIQRFSGIYIALVGIAVVLIIWSEQPANYQQWAAVFSGPWMQTALSIFIVTLLFHAWIGLRDIILDYIHPIWIKMLVMTAVVLMLVASGFWFLRALLLV